MPKYNVKLTKLNAINPPATGEGLRTFDVIGWTDKFPTHGEVFQMFAAPIDPDAAFRLVTTSNVEEVTTDDLGAMIFKTRNSEYKLELVTP